MSKTLLGAIGLVAALATSPAFADSDYCNVPMADWQPKAAVAEHFKSMGWDVSMIKEDDGCYEVKAKDQAGKRIKAYVNPKTFEIVKQETKS